MTCYLCSADAFTAAGPASADGHHERSSMAQPAQYAGPAPSHRIALVGCRIPAEHHNLLPAVARGERQASCHHSPSLAICCPLPMAHGSHGHTPAPSTSLSLFLSSRHTLSGLVTAHSACSVPSKNILSAVIQFIASRPSSVLYIVGKRISL